MVLTDKVIIPSDGTTNIKLGALQAHAAAASGGNILAAGAAGVKNRIYLLQVSVDTAGTITIGDYTNLKFYAAANSTTTLDFGHLGVKQGTAATAITCTNASGGNFTSNVIYSTDA